MIADVFGIVAFVWMVGQGIRWLYKRHWLPDIASMFVPSGPITLDIGHPVFKKHPAVVLVETKTHQSTSSAYLLRKLHEDLTKYFRQSIDLAVFTHPDADHQPFFVPHHGSKKTF